MNSVQIACINASCVHALSKALNPMISTKIPWKNMAFPGAEMQENLQDSCCIVHLYFWLEISCTLWHFQCYTGHINLRIQYGTEDVDCICQCPVDEETWYGLWLYYTWCVSQWVTTTHMTRSFSAQYWKGISDFVFCNL